MINDIHGTRIVRDLSSLPDEYIHDVAAEIELKMLEAGIKVEDMAMFYESLRRQEPKIHSVTVTDRTGATDKVG